MLLNRLQRKMLLIYSRCVNNHIYYRNLFCRSGSMDRSMLLQCSDLPVVREEVSCKTENRRRKVKMAMHFLDKGVIKKKEEFLWIFGI